MVYPGGAGVMPEHRGRKHHQDRVAETLREEIGAMIEGELSDPRIAFCYVSEVVLNPGGKSARVYVAIDSAVPEFWKVERIPDAAPRWRAGTLLMTEAEFGALNMPTPIPLSVISAAKAQ